MSISTSTLTESTVLIIIGQNDVNQSDIVFYHTQFLDFLVHLRLFVVLHTSTYIVIVSMVTRRP